MNPTHAVSSILPPEAILERLLPGHDFLVRLHFSYSQSDASIYLLSALVCLVLFAYAGPILSFETNKHPAPSASAYKTRLECI